MSQNVLSNDRDVHMETLLRLFQSILTSEANRSSRYNRVLSLRPDCVTKNSVTETILHVRDDYTETML